MLCTGVAPAVVAQWLRWCEGEPKDSGSIPAVAGVFLIEDRKLKRLCAEASMPMKGRRWSKLFHSPPLRYALYLRCSYSMLKTMLKNLIHPLVCPCTGWLKWNKPAPLIWRISQNTGKPPSCAVWTITYLHNCWYELYCGLCLGTAILKKKLLLYKS